MAKRGRTLTRLKSVERPDLPPLASAPFRSAAPALPLARFLAAVFALKLLVVFQLKDHILLQPDAGLDTSVYLELARRAASGDLGLGPGLYFVSPLYIYFAALVVFLTDSIAAIRIVQIAFGTAAVGLLWWTAREWAGRRAAWLAAGAAALTGLFTFYETLLLQAALDPFLTAVALAALTAALTRPQPWWFVAAGAAFGIQSLNRPNVLVAAAGVLVLLVVVRRWRGAAALGAGALLALLPITMRNGVVAGAWTPVSSHGGLNFYIGNSPAADGTYSPVPGITPSIAGQREDSRRVAERGTGRRMDDPEVSAYFYGLAFKWLREEPAAAARLLARKLFYVFNAAHLSLNHSYPFYAYDAGTLLGVLAIGPWLLMPLGLAGLGWTMWTRRSTDFAIWASFVPLYALAVAAFFVSERYRLPLLVPLCVGAGAALDAAWTAIATRRLRSIAGLGGMVAVLALVTNWPLRLDDGRAEERTRMAERSALLTRAADAESWTRKAEELHSRPGVLHFRVARALMSAGEVDAALRHLRASAEIDPEQPEVHFALGQALLQRGHPAEAIPHLRRAYEAGVRPDLAGYDLTRALAAAGERAEAVAVLEKVRPASGDDADSWLGLGQLALELRAVRTAAMFYAEAVRVKPDSAAARRQLGVTYAALGQYRESAGELERAASLAPSDPVTRLNLAVAYAELGRIEDARAQARRALELDPAYARARQLLDVLK